MKVCELCNKEKELSDFYFIKKGNYYDNKCKLCRSNLNKSYRLLNKDEINKIRSKNRNTTEGKLHRKTQSLRYKYNITLEEYNRIYNEQNGLCSICCKPQKNNKYFSVDHNHKTGEVRGLLCSGCNAKLGWFESYHNNITKYLGKSL